MYWYQYLHDPEFVIESETRRDDLLEWAYWSEIPAPAAKAKPEPVEVQPDPEATPVTKPARKPRTLKAAEGE